MIVTTSTKKQFDTAKNVPSYACNTRNKVRATKFDSGPGLVEVKIFHKTGILVQTFKRQELNMVMEMFKGAKFSIRAVH